MASDISIGEALEATKSALIEVLGARGEKIDAASITPETLLYNVGGDSASLGLDSLDALDLIGILEERFDVAVVDEVTFEHIHCVLDVAKAIVASSHAA